MKIADMINNHAFTFNAPFRILIYHGKLETTPVFDSTVSGDMPFDLMLRDIIAINTGDDGILEIECE